MHAWWVTHICIVVSNPCAFPWWTCPPSGLSSDTHSWDMPSRAVAAWSARSKGCESSRTPPDLAERADKRYSVMARTFRHALLSLGSMGPGEAG